MLEKMGWKKGEGLGKEGTGMKDPVSLSWLVCAHVLRSKTHSILTTTTSSSFPPQIELKIRTSQSGLGSGATLSVDSASINKSKSQKNWEKARVRYAGAFQPDAPAPKAPNNESPKAWVRAEDAVTLAELDSEG